VVRGRPLTYLFPMRNRRSFSMRAIAVGWCLALGLWASGAARGDDVLPKASPANRYDKMSTHSPFSPPTVAPSAPVTVAAPTGTWTDKLAVTLLMQNGGVYVATVVDRDSSRHFLVTSDRENDRQMMLTNVQWGDKNDAPRITIRQGNASGQVAFDPTAGGGGVSVPQPGGPASMFRPPIPGAANQPVNQGAPFFHPPPGGRAPGGPITPSAVIRRPPIPAAPVPVNPRIVNGLSQQAADDDDDDDQ
jgi:hypothetical protein